MDAVCVDCVTITFTQLTFTLPFVGYGYVRVALLICCLLRCVVTFVVVTLRCYGVALFTFAVRYVYLCYVDFYTFGRGYARTQQRVYVDLDLHTLLRLRYTLPDCRLHLLLHALRVGFCICPFTFYVTLRGTFDFAVDYVVALRFTRYAGVALVALVYRDRAR